MKHMELNDKHFYMIPHHQVRVTMSERLLWIYYKSKYDKIML